MTGPEFEKAIVALACYQIGHKELYRGMSAVAMMFQNRVAAGTNADLHEAAVRYMCNDLVPDFPDSRDPEFQKLLSAVEAAFAGTLIDKTGGSTSYREYNAGVDVPTAPALYTVGQLHFYR